MVNGQGRKGGQSIPFLFLFLFLAFLSFFSLSKISSHRIASHRGVELTRARGIFSTYHIPIPSRIGIRDASIYFFFFPLVPSSFPPFLAIRS